MWAWSAGVLFSRFGFGHRGWTDKHAGVETEYETNDDGLWSYGRVSRRFDPNGPRERPNRKHPPYGRCD